MVNSSIVNELAMATVKCIGLIVIAVIAVETSSIKTNSNGGYDHVVVSITSNLNNSKIHHEQFISQFQNFFTTASEYLFNATHQKVYFGNISILLPNSWPNLPFTLNATFETYHESDIRIGSFNPYLLKQEEVYTQQPRGCGRPGNFICLPYNKIADWDPSDYKFVKQFVNEWAKFKYGVFDEFGYRNDPMYPDTYLNSNGEERVTNCKGSDIKGFCDSNTHDVEVPTRQNLLCDLKSKWEIISAHSEFQGIITNSWKKPEFKFVKMIPMAASLIIDPRLCNNSLSKYNSLMTAIVKFIKDFPFGGKLSVIIADNNSTNIPLTTMTNMKTRYEFLAEMYNLFGKLIPGNFENAFAIAEKSLRTASRKGPIIFFSGPELNETSTFPIIFNAIEKNPLLNFLLITITQSGDLNTNQIPNEEDIRDMNKYRQRFTWFNIRMKPLIEDCNFEAVLEMESILHQVFNIYNEEDFYFKRKRVYVGHSGEGNFSIFNGKEMKAIDRKGVTLIFTVRVCPLFYHNNIHKLYINGKLQNDLDVFPPWHELHITHTLKTNVSDINFNLTIGTKSGHELKNIRISVWMLTDDKATGIDSHLNGEIVINDFPYSTTFPPVKIYAYSNIQEKIIAEIVSSNGNKSTIELTDNGRGDPDTKHDDGIQSGYFAISCNQSGTYSIRLRAGNTTTDLGMRYLPASNASIFRPNRIVDFEISSVSHISGNVKVKWSPAMIYTNNSIVFKYAMKCSPSRQEVVNVNTSNFTRYLLSNYQRARSKFEYEWTLIEEDSIYICIYYCIIWGINQIGQTGPPSNVITISVPKLFPERGIMCKPPEKQQAVNYGIIASACFSSVVIGVLIITAYLRSKSVPEVRNSDHSNETDRDRMLGLKKFNSAKI